MRETGRAVGRCANAAFVKQRAHKKGAVDVGTVRGKRKQGAKERNER